MTFMVLVVPVAPVSMQQIKLVTGLLLLPELVELAAQQVVFNLQPVVVEWVELVELVPIVAAAALELTTRVQIVVAVVEVGAPDMGESAALD